MSTNPFRETKGLYDINCGIFEEFSPPNKITVTDNSLIKKVLKSPKMFDYTQGGL